MKIYAVIPVHNRRSFTKDCLESLRHQVNDDFEIVVVDDGSTDGTAHMIANEFPHVTLLKGDGDLWWVGAVNKGVRYVFDVCDPEDCVLLLNDDLVVPVDYIKRFRELWGRFPDTLIGSVVTNVDDPDIIVDGGVLINWFTAKFVYLNTGGRLSDFAKRHYLEVSTLTGRGVLIPTKVFRELGLYKTHYVQCGDIELPARAARAGYRLIVSYDAVVYSFPTKGAPFNGEETSGLSDFWFYFGDIRSHSNLRTRIWFARDTANSLLQGIAFFVFDLGRNMVHFAKRLR